MLDDGEIERRVRLIRPMEQHSVPLKMMAESHWVEVDRERFSAAWLAELAEVPEFSESTIHIVAGLLLPIWKRLPNESTRVYRLQTDAGERIIGRKVSAAWVANVLATGAPELTPDAAFAALTEGRTVLDLAEGLQLRRVRVMGAYRIELSGFTDTMRDRLRAYGLFGEIISWKLRMFVPTDASGAEVLAKVLERYRDRAHRRTGGRVMPRDASELAHRLAREAEAVCRHYLSNGRREGRYWLVGDVRNTPGRSMFVRLQDSPKGPAGKWTDAATGEHGDLLDVIRESCGLRRLPRCRRRGAALSQVCPALSRSSSRSPLVRQHRLDRKRPHDGCLPCRSRLQGTSLRRICAIAALRLCTTVAACASIRAATIGPTSTLPTETWPAMIACVTDLDGRITGVHRTWLDPDGFDRVRLGKAPIDTPRRAMGDLLGNAVRFGVADDDVLAAGEGIETMLSLRCVLPTLPMAAALSANHLSAMLLPPRLRRLYIARDADAAGDVRASRSDRSAQKPPASKRSRCRLGWATSTRICTSSASMPFGQRCGFSSHRRTSPASCSCRPLSNKRVWLPSTSTARSSDGPMPERPRPRPSRGRSDGRRPGPAMAAPGYFPPALRAFASRSKIAGLRHPPLALRPSAVASGSGPFRPPSE